MDVSGIVDLAVGEGAAQKREELQGLVELVCEYRPAVVIEIGTLRGGTLRAWCECATDDALIVSVDLPGGEWGGGYREQDIPRLKGMARPEQHLVLLRSDSHLAATRRRVSEILAGRKADLLFIDGDHSLAGVRQDFRDYSKLVARGGLIAFHDIAHHPEVPGCEVDKLWKRLKGKYMQTWEFVHDGDNARGYGSWGGIGVIVWPGSDRPPA